MDVMVWVNGKAYHSKSDGKTPDMGRPWATNSGSGSTGGTSGTYSFGTIKDANGNVVITGNPSNKSFTDAWNSFMQTNAGNVLAIANALGGNFTNAADAGPWLKSHLQDYGQAPGGLAGWVAANGPFTKSSRGNYPGGGSGVSAAQKALAEQSAKVSVNDTLRYYGLTNLTDWAWGKIQEGFSASDVVNMIPDTVEFGNRFPGIAMQRFTGQNEMTPTEYIAFENGARDLADRYGFSKDLLSRDRIGQIIGGGVSLAELQDRFNNSYAMVSQADPNVKAALTQYAGVTPAQMAQYWLDPTHTSAQLLEEAKKASVGGAARDVGWKGTDKGFLAEDIATVLAQQGVTQAQAQAGYGKIAGLQPLERAQVGQRGQAVASANQLQTSEFAGLSKTLGISPAEAQAALLRAQEARAAGLAGGGTYANTQKGVTGLGRASSEGTGNV